MVMTYMEALDLSAEMAVNDSENIFKDLIHLVEKRSDGADLISAEKQK